MQAAATASDFLDLPDDNADFLHDENPHKVIAQEAAKVTLYRAACKKCNGSGRYYGPSSLGHSLCTLCKGRGYFETKVSPEQREARNARKAARKERAEAAQLAEREAKLRTWQAQFPAETQWLREAAPRFEFAAKMVAAAKQWGSLTEGQLNAVRRCMVQDAVRAEERAAREARAEAVDLTPIIAAFGRASNTLRTPVLRTPEFRFSKASAMSKNAGAIYVKTLGSEDVEGVYLGKLMDGRFFPSRDCSPEQQAAVIACCQDPKDAILRYARLTGNCGICGRKLDRKDSIERGIGPICAEKFGF